MGRTGCPESVVFDRPPLQPASLVDAVQRQIEAALSLCAVLHIRPGQLAADPDNDRIDRARRKNNAGNAAANQHNGLQRAAPLLQHSQATGNHKPSHKRANATAPSANCRRKRRNRNPCTKTVRNLPATPPPRHSSPWYTACLDQVRTVCPHHDRQHVAHRSKAAL
jgi:hypothetical protein